MGTLHGIYKLRSDEFKGAAFLKVKASAQTDFEERYNTLISKYFDKDDLTELYGWFQKLEEEKKSYIEKWLVEVLQGPLYEVSSVLWEND